MEDTVKVTTIGRYADVAFELGEKAIQKELYSDYKLARDTVCYRYSHRFHHTDVFLSVISSRNT